MTKQAEEILSRSIGLLAKSGPEEERMVPNGSGAFPSIECLREVISLVKRIIFPDFLNRRRNSCVTRAHSIGVDVDKLYTLLRREIENGLRFDESKEAEDTEAAATPIVLGFIETLPEIKRMLLTDVEAMFNNDPAVENFGEIILCYPVVQAMVHYRVAHALLKLGMPVIPRIITEIAHSDTGIDIHPGAQIGEYFSIDHGTGVVIGETCVIGNHVNLYQGVTLGAKNFSLDSNGRPVNIPRHPIIEDNVTIYSNATVLGRITIGKGSIIGGNVWLTNSVPPGSRILQRKAVNTSFIDGLGI